MMLRIFFLVMVWGSHTKLSKTDTTKGFPPTLISIDPLTTKITPSKDDLCFVSDSSLPKANSVKLPFGFLSSRLLIIEDASTIINYQLPEAGLVSLRIFDSMGREVKTLVNELKDKGSYNISFDASHLSSGVYFYQLRAGDFVSIKKMVLLK
ncbi:MAG: T9SS type A sorting domain-containing protein [Ignavibacteriaceae bacterium]